MAARRYGGFYAQSLKSRYRPVKKYSRGKDLFVLLALLSLALVVFFFFSPFAPSATNALQNLKGRLFKALKVDYIDFIGYTLPGMSKITLATLKTDDFFHEDTLVEVDPMFFLQKELAGFKIREDTGYYQATSAEKEESFSPDAPEEKEEPVSFLLNRRLEHIKEKPLKNDEGKPQVLIYHTHASESFVPLSGEAFSDDPGLTVVSLGAYLAELLENNYRIPAIHHREFYDTPRHYAYEKVRSPLERLLKENPQIKIVLDLHRDGVSRQITTAAVEGKDTARILFVVGSRHEGWYNNMRFALFLEKELNEKYPGLSRGIRSHPFVYNQDLHQRSLIVEIGGHENSEEEIRRAVAYFAEALAATLP